jgi:nucleoside-diphosphate-sugar epimerase
MALHTILGAGGTMAHSLLAELSAQGQPMRLVSRRATPVVGAQAVAADVTNFRQLREALAGSTVVYLLVGLPYSTSEWQATWPLIMRNTIEACKQVGARLVFFDNVYMYGLVRGTQTEETPFNPISKKGEVRAQIAGELLREMQAGNLLTLVARSAEFYGPHSTLQVSLVNMLLFSNLAQGQPAQWFGSGQVPHSFGFTTDMAQALYRLAGDEQALGQAWHLPTAPHPPTITELVQLAAPQFQALPDLQVMSRAQVAEAAPQNPVLAELLEMLYQYDEPYVFDSSKFERTYGVTPTPYADGIRLAADDFKRRQGAA